VATAIKNVVSPATEVSTTSDNAKKDANATAPLEDLAPKSAVTDGTSTPRAPLPSVIELRLTPAKSQLTVGEKSQLAIELNSEARLGLAVVMLRFDPNVLKVTSVAAGKMFADAKSMPTISQSLQQKGVLLVSIAPAAGAQIFGEGALVNVEVEAIGAGDSSVAFDLSNVHLVSADGQATVLQLAPASLTVKPAQPATIAKPASEEAAAPAVTQATAPPNVAAAVEAALGAAISVAPEAAKSYVVQKKDNLWKIATEHGITVASLRQANPKLRTNVVTVGSELVIP
jgi:LysM repeat protein